jgi:predicted ATPase/class 3 adenylate cyclase
VAELPSGTVTFLFTDVEGSTRLWEQHPESMRGALARHDEILRDAIDAHDGFVVKTTGDGIHAAFASAHDAVDAAVAMQLSLGTEEFAQTGALRVRMGLHTCEAEPRAGDYYGSGVNRAARLMSVAHGGQIVVSVTTSELLRDHDVELVDLGEHRLRDLTDAARVFQVQGAGLSATFPPLRSLDVFLGNLPVQMSSFVGRDAEIKLVADAVRGARIVTLTGVGGVGKTRLALQTAAEVVGEFPDGAWLCEFAPVASAAAAWEALAASLRVQPFPGRALDDSVLEFLAEKRLLLLLDNCEHLLDAIARQVDIITRRCPRVSVLATSREGLALAGERMVAVPSLSVPEPDDGDPLAADAVQLFWDRAHAAKTDFILDGHNAAAVAVLCRRLDGIPLAIELAAARVRSMSADDLVARLDQRFKLLTRGSRAALERHQTLRSTIDWSYDLLGPTERAALNRLSVFAGGCELAAAEWVLADDDLDRIDVDDVLGRLVDKSLVVADEDDDGVRYRLLESIRQYAQEQLEASDEAGDARRRHADYYVAWSEAAGPHLRGRDHLPYTKVAVRNVDNLRAALDWAVEEPSPDHALRLVAPMTLQGIVGEPALGWAVTACMIPGAADHPLFPVVAAWASWSATRALDFAQAEELAARAEAAQEVLGFRHPSVVRAWATLAFYRGDPVVARQQARVWVELARATGDPYELAHSLTMFGGSLVLTGEVSAAGVAAINEAVSVARAAGIDSALGFALQILGISLPVEESDRAQALLDEVIAVTTRIGDPMSASNAMGFKGWLAVRRGEWAAALDALIDGLEQKVHLGDLSAAAGNLFGCGVALYELGALEPAAVAIGKADATTTRFGPEWTTEIVKTTDAALADRLGAERVAELAAQGAALEFRDAIAYVRAEAGRARAAP